MLIFNTGLFLNADLFNDLEQREDFTLSFKQAKFDYLLDYHQLPEPNFISFCDDVDFVNPPHEYLFETLQELVQLSIAQDLAPKVLETYNNYKHKKQLRKKRLSKALTALLTLLGNALLFLLKKFSSLFSWLLKPLTSVASKVFKWILSPIKKLWLLLLAALGKGFKKLKEWFQRWKQKRKLKQLTENSIFRGIEEFRIQHKNLPRYLLWPAIVGFIILNALTANFLASQYVQDVALRPRHDYSYQTPKNNFLPNLFSDVSRVFNFSFSSPTVENLDVNNQHPPIIPNEKEEKKEQEKKKTEQEYKKQIEDLKKDLKEALQKDGAYNQNSILENVNKQLDQFLKDIPEIFNKEPLLPLNKIREQIDKKVEDLRQKVHQEVNKEINQQEQENQWLLKWSQKLEEVQDYLKFAVEHSKEFAKYYGVSWWWSRFKWVMDYPSVHKFVAAVKGEPYQQSDVEQFNKEIEWWEEYQKNAEANLQKAQQDEVNACATGVNIVGFGIPCAFGKAITFHYSIKTGKPDWSRLTDSILLFALAAASVVPVARVGKEAVRAASLGAKLMANFTIKQGSNLVFKIPAVKQMTFNATKQVLSRLTSLGSTVSTTAKGIVTPVGKALSELGVATAQGVNQIAASAGTVLQTVGGQIAQNKVLYISAAAVAGGGAATAMSKELAGPSPLTDEKIVVKKASKSKSPKKNL